MFSHRLVAFILRPKLSDREQLLHRLAVATRDSFCNGQHDS